MYNISFSRTSTERADVNHTIRSMSYNVPGHQDRLKAHRERVQRDYFDNGLCYKDMHPGQAQGKLKRCCHCKKSKSITKFSRDKRRKDELQPDCKKCHIKAIKQTGLFYKEIHKAQGGGV